MIEYILMTQLYFTDGTYEFRNYNMVSENLPITEICNDRLKENALKLSSFLSGRDKREIKQEKAMCTDFHSVLSFYPIPDKVPVPTPRPKFRFIVV